MATTTDHFTAWLTTDASAVPNGNADISVLRDEVAGYKGDNFDIPVYESTGDPIFYVETDVNVHDDHEGLIGKAEKALRDAGWTVSGAWDGVDTGYVVTVTRS